MKLLLVLSLYKNTCFVYIKATPKGDVSLMHTKYVLVSKNTDNNLFFFWGGGGGGGGVYIFLCLPPYN